MTVLPEAAVDIVAAEDGARFRDPMQARHCPGAVPGTGGTVRHVARHRGRWLAPALKCGARGRRIGRDPAVRFGRLRVVTGNSRFPILPGAPRHPGSRALSPCAHRPARGRSARFGHEALPAETFVDPARFRGAICRVTGRIEAGVPAALLP